MVIVHLGSAIFLNTGSVGVGVGDFIVYEGVYEGENAGTADVGPIHCVAASLCVKAVCDLWEINS